MTKIFSVKERDLAFVPRWTITRNIRNQNVAEHSFFVALWAMRIATEMGWDSHDINCLVEWALTHDMREIFSGDQPSPYKAALGDKAEVADFDHMIPEPYHRLEGRWRSEMVKDKAKVILKICDLMEALAFIAEEKSMGNTTLQKCWGEIVSKLYKLTNFLPPELRYEIDQFISENSLYQSGITMQDVKAV